MSSLAFLGAFEIGLVFGLVAFGVYISFRILDFPDLTVDGSFPLGAAVTASLIVADVHPLTATLAAMLSGGLAGVITAWLNVRLKILHLLASILTMIALYSINLRIMGRPNVALLGERTLLTPLETLGLPYYVSTPIAFAVIVTITMLLLIAFFNSETGLAMRATGANPRMARSQGVSTSTMIVLGMAISNALVALAGSMFAQSQGSADVTMGVGTIIVGLASVIGGESILPGRSMTLAFIACLLGSIVYRFAVALALNADFLGLHAQDLNLITAVLVTIAICLPRTRASFKVRVRRN